MNKNRSRSSSLFLMELIIAILVFAIASAVCVQIFVASHKLSTQASELNAAVDEASSIAEIVNASSGISEAEELISAAYPDADVDLTEEGGMLSADIGIYSGSEEIYHLNVRHYVGNNSVEDGR